MKALRLPALVLPLAAALLSASGCAGDWLTGKWAFDRETTLEEIRGAGAEEDGEGGILRNVVSGLQKGAALVLAAQFEGVVVEFTSGEMRRIRHGSGDTRRYQVIDRPDSRTRVVQYEDGEIETWGRWSGGVRLKVPAAGEEQWIYFRRSG